MDNKRYTAHSPTGSLAMIGVIDAVRVGIRRPELLEISTHFPLLLDFIQLNIERPDYSPFPTLPTELCYIVAPLSLLLTSAQVILLTGKV